MQAQGLRGLRLSRHGRGRGDHGPTPVCAPHSGSSAQSVTSWCNHHDITVVAALDNSRWTILHRALGIHTTLALGRIWNRLLFFAFLVSSASCFHHLDRHHWFRIRKTKKVSQRLSTRLASSSLWLFINLSGSSLLSFLRANCSITQKRKNKKKIICGFPSQHGLCFNRTSLF